MSRDPPPPPAPPVPPRRLRGTRSREDQAEKHLPTYVAGWTDDNWKADSAGSTGEAADITLSGWEYQGLVTLTGLG